MKKAGIWLLIFVITTGTLVTGCSNSASGPLSFSRLISQADQYNGKTVTLEAFYFSGFEISAVAGSLERSTYDTQRIVPVNPLVWVNGGISRDLFNKLYTQTITPSGYPEYFGKLKISGRFETGSKYGHLNAYQYQINITSGELLDWTPPPTTTSAISGGNLLVTVTDSSNRPLGGAKVVSEEQPAGQLKVTGLTNSSGTVTFNNIKSGNYRFYINRFDYVQDEMSVAVTAGQTAEKTVYLTPAN